MKQQHIIQPVRLKKKKAGIHLKNGVSLKLADATSHHRASSSIRTWVVILMVIEYIICTLNCMYICAAGILNTLYIRGYLEYSCGFQSWCCLGVLFIFPLLMLLSLWRKIFSVASFGLLVVGGLYILSGIVILLNYMLYLGWAESEEVLIPNGSSAWLMLLIPFWGVGNIIRYWCGRKYGYVFYSASLIKSYQMDLKDFHMLLTTLVFYISVYVVIFLFFNIQ